MKIKTFSYPLLYFILTSCFFILVLLFATEVLAINSCGSGWRVNIGGFTVIDCHDTCKKVHVYDTADAAVFVPTNSSLEWTTFLNNLPPKVSLYDCFACGDNITFTYKGSQVTYGTVKNNTTGECWMDRNLGASRVATAYNDSSAYGNYFQWGRLDDLHQNYNSGTTATLSSSDVPGHSYFILNSFDWRDPQNSNLWQGVSGINNPCPDGWRIPTEAEWTSERQSWWRQDYYGAFDSPLKLTAGGYRYSINGDLDLFGFYGRYWSSTISSAQAQYLQFTGSDALIRTTNRGYGMTVRCILD